MFSYGEDVIDQMNQKEIHDDIEAALTRFAKPKMP